MKRFGIGVLWSIAGYVIAAFAGYVLVILLSSNMHDKDLEAAMTGIFACGPFGGSLALLPGSSGAAEDPAEQTQLIWNCSLTML